MANGFVSTFKTALTKLYARLLNVSDAKIVLALIALVFCLRLIVLDAYPFPQPIIHDEQANMLGAETFALGRLTNPPLLFPDSLYQIHTLSEPTRTMKYQPATALFMAAGIVGFGHAAWGILLCAALMIAACYWAVRAWASKPIALAFALFVAVNFRAPHYWIDSYWGGAPIALASFLLLGAYAHIFLHKRYSAVWLGMFGALLAAISRPVEGGVLILCLFIIGAVTFYMRFSVAEKKQVVRAMWLPVVLISSLYLGAQGYYNKTITGDALMLPYAAYEKSHGIGTFTILQPPAPVKTEQYVNHAIQEWEVEFYKNYTTQKKIKGFLIGLFSIIQFERFYFPVLYGFGVIVGLIIIIYAPAIGVFRIFKPTYQEHWVYTPLCLSYVGLLGMFCISLWSFAHYLAPLFCVLTVLCTRILYDSLQRHSHHVFLPRIKLLASILYVVLLVSSLSYHLPRDQNTDNRTHRASLEKTLLNDSGKDLVFVNAYEDFSDEKINGGWVYNAPDIETAPIIWAWDLSAAQNQAVIEHYKGRKVWYIKPSNMQNVIPYDAYVKRKKL